MFESEGARVSLPGGGDLTQVGLFVLPSSIWKSLHLVCGINTLVRGGIFENEWLGETDFQIKCSMKLSALDCCGKQRLPWSGLGTSLHSLFPYLAPP